LGKLWKRGGIAKVTINFYIEKTVIRERKRHRKGGVMLWEGGGFRGPKGVMFSKNDTLGHSYETRKIQPTPADKKK